MHPHARSLGVDFGTSNSSAAWMVDGQPQVIELSPGETTLPSTFFFEFDSRQTLIGTPANQALLDGAEGRFMRALKRVLGTSLMHEPRQILNERVTFVDIIARFLAELKRRAEARTGAQFDHVVSGRPVVFHGPNDPREAQAEADLRTCYLAAGFASVDFLPEPHAAALASSRHSPEELLGLIVDIGGGTSDFSAYRQRAGQVDILANHGVRIGGTDFDRTLSIAHVMPLLGKGGSLRKTLGAGATPAPKAIFNDLATWELIPFLYTGTIQRQVDEFAKLGTEPEKFKRLQTVLRDHLGHDLAFATEAGKIAANGGAIDARIALDVVERGLSAPLTTSALTEDLAPHGHALTQGALATLNAAGLSATQITDVVYIGGSSLMNFVGDAMSELFPKAQHRTGNVFTAVADGLAIAASA